MKTYQTAQVARMTGIHPNTVRLYEALRLIPRPERRDNGYRVFTDVHVEQIRLARTALQVEVLQNGLRRQAVTIIKTSAGGDYDQAIRLTGRYIKQLRAQRANAEEAIAIVRRMLSGGKEETAQGLLTRKETADSLQVTIDTLRNWEMNGLLTVRRRQNGYRVYTGEDIRRLKMIRSLRCANYSLAAILRMLDALSSHPDVNIERVIDTPAPDDGIISVCDKLITSLRAAEHNAAAMVYRLKKLKALSM